MNKTHGSRKQDIKMYIKLEILKGHIKNAISLCERYQVSPKDFGRLVKEITLVG